MYFLFIREVKQLVQYGADVNQQTSKSCGITPMHWACGLGDTDVHVEIVRFLLSYCGSPNVKATEGLTPVHIAASWGFINILKILINNGGNPWLEDHEGHNAWDLALQKAQWDILKYLATYMEEDVSEPREDSVDYRFNKYVGVNDLAFLYNSTLTTSSINLGFLGASAVSGNETQNNVLNNGICQSSFITVNSTLSNSVIVEEYVYKDKEKGVSLVEWKYPPLIIEETVLDATLNEAICSSKDDGDSMDSQLLIDELKLLGSNPGPITCTTKQTYLRQLYRLRKEQAKGVPSPQREGNSKELHIMLLKYPGHESDTKISSHLDRLFVTHFTCPDPGKPWREGLSKKSFNYLLLDPRVTHNLPMNETQDQAKLFAKFVASIFYVGKGKPSRPYEHLYEAIKIRSRPQGLLKVQLPILVLPPQFGQIHFKYCALKCRM